LLFTLHKLASAAGIKKGKMIPTAGQFSPNKTQVTKSRLLPPTRNWMQRKEILDVTADDCGTVQQQQLVEAPARGPSHP
jgi:hypothetical protein